MKSFRQLFLSLLISLFLFCPSVWAALSATVLWELRSAGATTNGACFDSGVAVPGTDYSQQNSSQFSGTNLAINAVTNTQVLSATHNFVASDEGNCIHITAGTGFTTGWYEILDTTANEAILDRSPGAIGITGGTWALGGAGFIEDAVLEAPTAGNVFYLKNDGTHTLTGNIAILKTGNTTSNIIINGYNSVRGDNPTLTSRPTIAAGSNTTNWASGGWTFKNFIITTTSTNGLSINAISRASNLKSTNSSGSADLFALNCASSRCAIVDSEAISTNGNAINCTNTDNILQHNYIHDSKVGVNLQASGTNSAISGNIFDTNVTGITGSIMGQLIISGNTFYNSTTCILGVRDSSYLISNIFNTCTTAVSWDALRNGSFDDYNNYSNNGTDVVNWTKGSNDTTGSPGFVDAPNGNFAINITLKSTGAPGAFPGSLSTGFMDPGAVQRKEQEIGIGALEGGME